MIEPEKEIIILKHKGVLNYFAYDILVLKHFTFKFDTSLYQTNCPYVEKFLEQYPQYKFVGAEDEGHLNNYNWIAGYINELLATGKAQIINYEEDDIND
jgi:hypothetical protein